MKYYLNFDINYYDGLNVQIMVRTKGLDQALDRIIGRAIGRKDNRDSNEALQRQRPIAFTRRQREVVPVAEDVHHVDDAADEVFQ